jgi:uncharacterized membrane protein
MRPDHRPGAVIRPGILLGLGLGGFFDGIVLHQILQWHHLLTSAGYPPTTVANLEVNTLADGLFHSVTYAFTVMGFCLLWGTLRRMTTRWQTRLLADAFLVGWGLFNLVEGPIDHHLLTIHHVNEVAPQDQWIYWDLGFLLWGSAMLVLGWRLLRTGRPMTAE